MPVLGQAILIYWNRKKVGRKCVLELVVSEIENFIE